MSKGYCVIRCGECNKDITTKTQVFDWVDKHKTERCVLCEDCNLGVK